MSTLDHSLRSNLFKVFFRRCIVDFERNKTTATRFSIFFTEVFIGFIPPTVFHSKHILNYNIFQSHQSQIISVAHSLGSCETELF
jgi:methyl coenzyme M reductase beta subunit